MPCSASVCSDGAEDWLSSLKAPKAKPKEAAKSSDKHVSAKKKHMFQKYFCSLSFLFETYHKDLTFFQQRHLCTKHSMFGEDRHSLCIFSRW